MGLENVVYVVDYDIPTKNATKRVDFYRKVHRMLRQHYGKDVEFSSFSCYFTDDEALAKKFMELVAQYSKRCHLYKAVKVQ
jgi:hypothetical protein